MTWQLQQTDTSTGGDGGDAKCSSVFESLGGITFRLASKVGTPGSTPATVIMGGLAKFGGDDEVAVCFESPAGEPGLANWAAGDYIVRLNRTDDASLSILSWVATYICRVNSSNVSQATVGSLTGQTTDILNTGIYTHTISGTEQTANAGDRLYFVLVFAAPGTANSSALFDILPNQLIDTPLVEGGGGDPPSPRLYRASLLPLLGVG